MCHAVFEQDLAPSLGGQKNISRTKFSSDLFQEEIKFISISRPKFLMNFFSHRLYFLFRHPKFLLKTFFSLRTLPHIQYQCFSKYWGMGRPPPQILGDLPPVPPKSPPMRHTFEQKTNDQ